MDALTLVQVDLADKDFAKRAQQTSGADALVVTVASPLGAPQQQLLADCLDAGLPVIFRADAANEADRDYLRGLAEKFMHASVVTNEVELNRQLSYVAVKKKLFGSRVIVLGEYRMGERTPVKSVVKERIGVDLIDVTADDFLAKADRVPAAEADAIAKAWTGNAIAVLEPSKEDVLSAARIYVALKQLLEERQAQASSVGCLEIMYNKGRKPFCWVLASLRDIGLPAGCEGDAGATLTLLLLEYLAERPGYMGNTVRVDPKANQVSISHGCSPVRMNGRDEPALAYKLVHSHSSPPYSRDLTGGDGLTSYVDYGAERKGQIVTIARIGAGIDSMTAARGEIVECRDTICDRTTLTIQVKDARDFFHKAQGNHQCVIYGDYVDDLRGVSRLLGMEFLEA